MIGFCRISGPGQVPENNRPLNFIAPSARVWPSFCKMTRTEKLLAELIALPSVNPAFAAAAGPAAASGAFPFTALWWRSRWRIFWMSVAGRAGLEVEFQKVLPDRYNIIARLLAQKSDQANHFARPTHGHGGRGNRRSSFPSVKTAGCMAGAHAIRKVPWPPCSAPLW